MSKILGIRIDNWGFEESLKKCIQLSEGKELKYICTINPEICLKANENPKYKRILNKSALNTADGSGILWAIDYLEKTNGKSKLRKTTTWFTSLVSHAFKKQTRITGVDLMQSICKQSKSKIFLLGAAKGVAEKAAKNLKVSNPSLNIAGTSAESHKEHFDKKSTDQINKSKAEILFVAFGAPNQEIWIVRNSKKLRNIKLAIGVGGSFDFISQNRKRAPKWMQKTGIEWVYRLIQEPQRIGRIFNATIIFPISILKQNLK